MKAPKKEKYISILSKLPNKIEEIAQAVISEKRGRTVIYWMDYLISALGEFEKKGTPKFGSRIKVLDTCTGCGVCSKNCCSSNISMESQVSTDLHLKPKFGNRCDMCLGCVYNCPQKALQPTYGAFQTDKNGYDLKQMCKNAKVEEIVLQGKIIKISYPQFTNIIG
jgi:ferredoxin